ncbi:hypothetical protein PFISCL1PPCAC_8474, partial [Pristionchus fissidentatus]
AVVAVCVAQFGLQCCIFFMRVEESSSPTPQSVAYKGKVPLAAIIPIVPLMIADLLLIYACLESYPHLVSPLTVILALLFLAFCYCLDSLRNVIPSPIHLLMGVLSLLAFFYLLAEITNGSSEKLSTAKLRTINLTMATLAFLWFQFMCAFVNAATKEETMMLGGNPYTRAVAAQVAAPAPVPAPIGV